MRYRTLSSSGDMQFGGGIANFYINQPEAVAQAVMTRLKLFQGEWFIDTSTGVPYMTKILGFGNIPTYDLIIKNTILETLGVNGIMDYFSYIDSNRNLSIEATIDTIYGQTTVSATL